MPQYKPAAVTTEKSCKASVGKVKPPSKEKSSVEKPKAVPQKKTGIT